ncbi:Major facilitator superfamily domain, general substrate transporter [Metarhizium album ARSEF 1941]|uniref:Major facilitator superfamily domain, general substrate transporter n=1 Tax=Metarhizium album (strain ARSEF 1941) TaxID=1081103 RepID=A0A0B2WUY9_METAS|nr:Major facilitator superfamily domain, general substrate transporter [Metarhizium album ARSEF 1941]KHN97893.1 Major facilitator superfamily domain, general substrate transporter [Metarhizium album ARSEF 1941]
MLPPMRRANTKDLASRPAGAGNHGSDDEKHERPAVLADSEDSSSDLETEQERRSLSRAGSARSGRSLTAVVSEVRDGIQNQRDLERGNGEDGGDARAGEDGEPKDPNLVSWDGPNDAQNPKAWPNRRKWAAVVCGESNGPGLRRDLACRADPSLAAVSLFTLISPVASSMVAPDLDAIGKELDIESRPERALVLSIFVAAYALGPLGWGPLSELYGRVIVIQSSNIVFLLFNLGCGLARTEGQMIAFRFLGGIGGSAPLAIGGGVLSDLFTPEERGRAISISSLMPLLGPAIGPVAGGWIAERTTWRWVFYSTTVACGIIQVFGLFFLQETYAPVLLHRKKLRLVRETGNTELRTEFDHPDRTVLQALTTAFTRPFKLLATQPIVQVLSLYLMFLYGTIYLIFSTFPTLFAAEYGESPGIIGLNYISIGVGFFLGTQVCAPLQDRVYAALKRRYVPDGGPGRPEFRVPMMVPGALLVPVGIFIYAWTAEAPTHWIGPNVGAAVFGFGSIIGFQCVQGYIVDSYTRYAASAVGAVTVLRSLAGFGFPLFAPTMYENLGYGMGGTVLATVSIVIGWPAPLLLWKYGAALRARSRFSTGP